MFTRGEVVYAGSEGDAAHDREPVAIFTGEVLPLYAGDLDDETVRMLLNELASESAAPSNRKKSMSGIAIALGH